MSQSQSRRLEEVGRGRDPGRRVQLGQVTASQEVSTNAVLVHLQSSQSTVSSKSKLSTGQDYKDLNSCNGHSRHWQDSLMQIQYIISSQLH